MDCNFLLHSIWYNGSGYKFTHLSFISLKSVQRFLKHSNFYHDANVSFLIYKYHKIYRGNYDYVCYVRLFLVLRVQIWAELHPIYLNIFWQNRKFNFVPIQTSPNIWTWLLFVLYLGVWTVYLLDGSVNTVCTATSCYQFHAS